MSDLIDISCSDHILTIRFTRPDKKNALTSAMYAAMATAIADAETNDDIRVVLFKGTEGCFTAGNDVGDFLQNPPTDPESPVFKFIVGLARATVPMVAAVDGPAVGIGTTLLLHCDLVLVTDTAKLQMPFVNLALLPEAGSTYLL
ncbi:MAG: enoyl-CoA hydratase/isomerase family protein, partial [Fimbriimonadaceae bacterium]|nr:enoyl-CoA hydratase/isomerase family protein [Alphaproteobacteria bacterium]